MRVHEHFYFPSQPRVQNYGQRGSVEQGRVPVLERVPRPLLEQRRGRSMASWDQLRGAGGSPALKQPANGGMEPRSGQDDDIQERVGSTVAALDAWAGRAARGGPVPGLGARAAPEQRPQCLMKGLACRKQDVSKWPAGVVDWIADGRATCNLV
jgi:hypothetical protein